MTRFVRTAILLTALSLTGTLSAQSDISLVSAKAKANAEAYMAIAAKCLKYPKDDPAAFGGVCRGALNDLQNYYMSEQGRPVSQYDRNFAYYFQGFLNQQVAFAYSMSDGYVGSAACQWLSEAKRSFNQIDPNGWPAANQNSIPGVQASMDKVLTKCR
ncbi:MAG: hypothetical protein IE933_09685 [Sphingomonadales bacterium]|nr:hypothetical protein [Sphingomonadales bacterium]MBD3774691.1 hypothetical protein [Paracoccaceae bacterium]